MYTPESIDKVYDLPIEEVIDRYWPLKRAGASYKAKSPFKEENTPSFVVSPAKQIFKCFASGEGGNLVRFVQLKMNLEWIEAVKLIAQDFNVVLDRTKETEEAKRTRTKKEQMYTLVEKVQRQYTKNLFEQPETHWVNQMLAKRGYTKEIAQIWQLGYAINEDQITQDVKKTDVLGVAKEVGLTATSHNSSYDPFKNRLMFPIFNERGSVIGFGGRRQDGDEYKSGKYINSKESDIYKKSEHLYGLHIAKHQMLKKGFAILVEGNTDVITMHQYGADTTVATCGTALTPKQAKLLKKYTENVVLMRDGDSAGYKATVRDIDILLAAGLNVQLVELAEKEDPDDFAKRIKDVSTYVIKNAKDAVIWKAEQIAESFISDEYNFKVEEIQAELESDIKVYLANCVSPEQLKDASEEELKKADKLNKEQEKLISNVEAAAAAQIKSLVKISPYRKTKGTTQIVEMLYNIKNNVTRKTYIDQISKIIDVSTRDLTKQVGELENKATLDRKKEPTFKDLGLPEGADVKFFLKHRFVQANNRYFFEKNNNKVEAGSTFYFNPLYHIKGKEENKRLCEVVNVYNQRQLMDFDSESFVSLTDLKKQLIRLGAYTFKGINSVHFEQLVEFLNTQFDSAKELQNLGQNASGFFAFANGIYYNKQFVEANKYGIIHLEGSDNDEDEYNEKIEYYFSPAFSAIHRKNQAGDDPYENDRKFVLKKSTVSLKDWQNQMVKVFGAKGRMGIVFNFASLFRDLFIKNYSYFPLLGGFGEKDSGKSGFGKCLQNFFYYDEKPVDLTQTTPVGFNSRMTRITNGVCFCDEYKETIHETLKFGLMGAWNGNGRTKGTIKKNRTTSPNINTALYYCGQFIPTFNDNALPTRTISLNFPVKEHSNEEKEEYNKLMHWTNKGLNSLVLELLQHREMFANELPEAYTQVARELKKSLEGRPFQGRIYDNYIVMLTAFKILNTVIEFPFSYEVFKNQCIEGIIENSESIQDSNGLTEFWNITQFLFEKGFIREGNHFKIERPQNLKIMAKNKQTVDRPNPELKPILYLRLNMVYQFYEAECQRRGIEKIGEGTLRNYFKSRKNYYIGLVKSKRFGSGSFSCIAFDYSYMSSNENNIVSLETLGPEVPGTPIEPTPEERQQGLIPFD